MISIQKEKSKSAFSLVEMAIILTIIGILSSVALVAFDLKKGAAIRLAAIEVEEINVAISSFYDALQEMPGDFDQASKFWSSNCSGGSVSCDGDGDNVIEAYSEAHLAWYHLTLTDFYAGQFSGTGDGDEQTQTANINVPASVIDGAQYAIIHYEWPEFPDEHMLILAGKTNGDIGKNSILDANTAYELDRKIDDGSPGTGFVYGRNGYNDTDWDSSNCLIDGDGNRVSNSEAKNSNWEYNMNIDSNECIMGFKFKSVSGYDIAK
ncbi:MAG: type II secretion system protein [Alphaproteobacteria bacterium]|jgi:type II secretory pathway pseudopilin PulG|nr:type II secretion system protein [Alphaproteobacteria bacterium]